MNRKSIQGILTGLLFIFATGLVANAQTYEDAVNAFNEGLELAQQGNLQGAVQAYERVLTITSELDGQVDPEIQARIDDIRQRVGNRIPQFYFNIAREKAQSGQLLEATEAFLEAAEQADRFGVQQIAEVSRGNVPRIFLTLGNRYQQQEQYENALDMYNRALDVQPSYVAAIYQIGLVYRAQDNLDSALEYFDRAIQFGSSLGETDVVARSTSAARNFLLERGVNHVEDQNYRQAIQVLRQALDYDDNHATIHLFLAKSYNGQDMFSDAIRHANRALQLEEGGRTDRAVIYFELGTALKYQGNESAACDAFENAAFGSIRANAEHELVHELRCPGHGRR